MQSEEIEKVATREETVDAVRKTQHTPGKNFTERKMSKLLYFNCGGDFPHIGNCSVKDKQCHECGKFGHFGKQCKTKFNFTPNRQQHQNYQPTFRNNQSNYRNNSRKHRPLNTVVTHSSDHFNKLSESSDEDGLFCISTLYDEKPFETGVTRKPRNGHTNFETVIRIESQKVKLLIVELVLML